MPSTTPDLRIDTALPPPLARRELAAGKSRAPAARLQGAAARPAEPRAAEPPGCLVAPSARANQTANPSAALAAGAARKPRSLQPAAPSSRVQHHSTASLAR